MGTKTIRLDEDVYERLRSKKSGDETFSEAVDRLIEDWTLLDFAEEPPVVDPEIHRDALDVIEGRGIDETERNLDRMDIEE